MKNRMNREQFPPYTTDNELFSRTSAIHHHTLPSKRQKWFNPLKNCRNDTNRCNFSFRMSWSTLSKSLVELSCPTGTERPQNPPQMFVCAARFERGQQIREQSRNLLGLGSYTHPCPSQRACCMCEQ